MKLKDFLKQFEGFDSDIEVGIFTNYRFVTNIELQIVEVELDYWNDEHVKAFNQSKSNKKLLLLTE